MGLTMGEWIARHHAADARWRAFQDAKAFAATPIGAAYTAFRIQLEGAIRRDEQLGFDQGTDKAAKIAWARADEAEHCFLTHLRRLMENRELQPRYVMTLRKHDRSEWRAVIVPPGQSSDFDPGGATRAWLMPYLGEDWHLMEILEVQQP